LDYLDAAAVSYILQAYAALRGRLNGNHEDGKERFDVARSAAARGERRQQQKTVTLLHSVALPFPLG
jgi:hypothetical protein